MLSPGLSLAYSGETPRHTFHDLKHQITLSLMCGWCGVQLEIGRVLVNTFAFVGVFSSMPL